NESGVEGTGPVADRVRAIFNRYASDQTSEE
ncbi:MAG: Lsm family RNA-binding protein, partial [Candidatus Hodarchaeales archaeon]